MCHGFFGLQVGQGDYSMGFGRVFFNRFAGPIVAGYQRSGAALGLCRAGDSAGGDLLPWWCCACFVGRGASRRCAAGGVVDRVKGGRGCLKGEAVAALPLFP